MRSGTYRDYWRADGEGGGQAVLPPRRCRNAGHRPYRLRRNRGRCQAGQGARGRPAVARLRARRDGEVANPFGYSRQLVQSKGGASTRRSAFFFAHDTETEPWWQGENARLGSMAAAARLAARHLREKAGDSKRKPERERSDSLEGSVVIPNKADRLGLPTSEARQTTSSIGSWAQSLRRLHAPRPRPQQHRLHVLRFLRVHERAGRHLQRDHGRLTRGHRHRLRPALRRDRQGRRLALGRAVAAARGVVSGGDFDRGLRQYLLNSATARRRRSDWPAESRAGCRIPSTR